MTKTVPIEIFVILFLIVKNDMTARRFEPNGHVNECFETLANLGLQERRHKKHEESAAARTGKFPTERPRRTGHLVDLIHMPVRDRVA